MGNYQQPQSYAEAPQTPESPANRRLTVLAAGEAVLRTAETTMAASAVIAEVAGEKVEA